MAAELVLWKKANSNLYSCNNIDAPADSAKNKDGENKTIKELCNEILLACGIKPLNSLETASTIRTKLKLKLPMHRFTDKCQSRATLSNRLILNRKKWGLWLFRNNGEKLGFP